MKDSHPILLLHGDDEEAIEEILDQIAEKQLATGLADFNFSRLDGKSISANDLANSIFALPLMTDRRTIILKNPLALAGGRDGNRKFLDLLESIPETTQMVLVIPDRIERKDWTTLGNSNFLRKWVKSNPEKAAIHEKKLPSAGLMREWIMKKAKKLGGEIEPSAAAMLVTLLGNDTRAISLELEKLLLYVDFLRPVDADDVQELVSGSVSVSVFDMIDALVAGNAKAALHTLNLLLEDQEAPALFAMIVRQFRLLIQTREILDERGGSAAVQSELDQIPFVADKLIRHANGFSLVELRTVYQQLTEMDNAFKTSQSDPKVALNTFVAQISQLLTAKKTSEFR